MMRHIIFLVALVAAILSLGMTFFAAESTTVAETPYVTSNADARILENAPTTNYRAATTLGADGDVPSGSGKDEYGLLRWDLASITPGTKISSASVTLTVSNSSPQTYEAYALKRAWAESEVTWKSYAAGSPWEVAGANGSLDRETTVAGTLTPSSNGERTFALSAAVVQRWVDDPATNHGIIIADTVNSDGFDFYSRESTTSSQRPRLSVNLEGGDTTLPETTIDSGPSETVSSSSASFSFSASEANSTFECSLDGDAFALCSSPKSYNSLPEGSHTFRVRATDTAGNTDTTPASRTWIVDTMSVQNDPVLVGAADIADDRSAKADDNETAQLIQTRWPEATVFATGDLAYEHGTLTQFNTYYHDSDALTQYSWGNSLNDQIKPVPGNHEYSATQGTPYAEGYFAYFNQYGIPVGDGPTNNRGYYYYDLGSHWRVFALNNGKSSVVATGTSSPQYAWLEARLKEADAQDKNVLAYFHHPLYSSGLEHGWRKSTSTNKLSCSAPSIATVKPFWDLLYKYGADLIVQAHDHNYERFVPINPNGTTTDANGAGTRPNPIQSFVVGTGGHSLKPSGDLYPTDYNGNCGPLRPQSAKFLHDKYGVLRLTLHPASFDYEYVQTTDGTDAIVADSGTGVPANP